MDRKKLLIFIIVLIVAVALLGVLFTFLFKSSENEETPSPEDGEITCITVTFGEDPKTCVNITWHKTEEATGFVSFQKDGSSEITEVSAESEVGENDYVYRTYITDLEVGTSYKYTITCGEKVTETYNFKTQSDDEEFNFIIVADEQGTTEYDYAVWENVIKTATLRDYDFILNLGDTVEDGKDNDQWHMFLDVSGGVMQNSSVISVLGNQDKKNTLRYYTYGSSENDPSAREYFSFTVGNVHFSILNSGDGTKDISNSQLKWLKSDLYKNADCFKIVCVHKAPYSNYNHCNDSEIEEIRAQLTPICEDYGVNIVLSGHDHAFYRGTIGNVVYLMNSSAGVKQHSGRIINTEIPYEVSTTMKEPTYTYVSVGSGSVKFDTYTVSDYGVETLFDSFSLPLQARQ